MGILLAKRKVNGKIKGARQAGSDAQSEISECAETTMQGVANTCARPFPPEANFDDNNIIDPLS